MTRRVLGLAVIACALLAPAALAQSPASGAQLQGSFLMAGTVTVAYNVRGEHVGEAVQRSWAFTSLCPTGPCATVRLVRQRATGTDTLTLHQTGPGAYAGAGEFSAPLRCMGRIYSPGQAVPFKITVHITATTASATGTVATAISATYVNSSRLNLTPCIGVLGHDSARYSGQPATAVPPA
jgi:hypothetical protein